MLATVQAIMGSTARASTTIEEYQRSFTGRIMALARTHSSLADDEWQAISIRNLLCNELEPYDDGSLAGCFSTVLLLIRRQPPPSRWEWQSMNWQRTRSSTEHCLYWAGPSRCRGLLQSIRTVATSSSTGLNGTVLRSARRPGGALALSFSSVC